MIDSLDVHLYLNFNLKYIHIFELSVHMLI